MVACKPSGNWQDISRMSYQGLDAKYLKRRMCNVSVYLLAEEMKNVFPCEVAVLLCILSLVRVPSCSWLFH